ncbi:MAG: HNH endonuclease [Cellulomonas sp.]|uniref:HNH endonuclease n=1 Tax=Cellulomonas sp. 73-92 TaxID=1895740 RepID=UPI000A648BC6|nr:HNH endonuclease [Cellulomonas sp. 73-92]MBN9375862.1 HNH endonuclease [Cellulomonas sp.]
MSAAIEQWRPVVGHPTYEVSDAGHVRNARTGHILAQTPAGKSGRYRKAHLGRSGRNRLVHRLVAAAFLGPAPSFEPHDVDHIDGDPTNNHVSNLRWLSKSLNSGRHPVFAARCGSRVLWSIPGDEPAPDDYVPLTDEELDEALAGWAVA